MQVRIHGNKIKITKSIKEYVNLKLDKLCRFLKDEEKIEAVVNIRVRNNEQTIEVTIPTKHFTIRAEESATDLYAAIDLVVDKLERQITKNKEKMIERYRSTIMFDFSQYEEVEEEVVKIVKRKNLDTKPMDEEEAILQMELVDHDFFIFKNIEEECVSLLYKRKDGKLGIINVK